MPRLLVIHTSLNGSDSLSSTLANDAAARWQERNPTGTIEELNFASTPIPHLTADTFGAFNTATEDRTPNQQELVALSDSLIKQVQEANEVILAVPMYNFGVPSQLRAYIDHIARAGITFRYTPDGPVGMVELEKVTVIATRGGRYAGTALDTQTAYLKNFFRFLGVTNVEFVYAEGLAMGEEALAESIASARSAIEALHAA
jgi:FMN-dependent NADH-azoreductase